MMKLLFLFAFYFGVGYADVVDGGEFVFEHLADAGDVAEGEVAVVELFLLYLAVDDVVNETVHGFFVMGFKALAGGFDAVDYHHYGSLGGEGSGTCVAEFRRVDMHTGVRLFLLCIEISGIGGSVMGAYEIGHNARKVVFVRKGYAIGYMLCDDACTLFVVELIVGVEVAALVLGEIEWGLHLSYIVIESSDTREEWVSADFADDVLADVGDLHGVLEGARSGA